ncbi:hypothetical protein KI387_003199, partial [Taxus chinensis]
LNRETWNFQELAIGMIYTFDYFSTKPPVNEALQVMKHLTLGYSAKDEELIHELLCESDLEACFEEEETNAEKLGCAYLEKEKGKMFYVIDDEEVDNLDAENIE